MLILKVENSRHNTVRLTQNENIYQLLNVEGVAPTSATLSTYNVAGLDGSRITGAKLTPRNLVITLKIKGDIEHNRQMLYEFFKTKEKCKIYLKTDNRDVFAEGYIESTNVDIFTNNEVMQISIICADPYFKAVEEIAVNISAWISNFTFPFMISEAGMAFTSLSTSGNTLVSNASESDTGVEFIIDFNDDVETITINNMTTEQRMTFNYNFLAYDRLTVNTNKGAKQVLLNRGGVITNLIGSLERLSQFITLNAGDNELNIIVDEDRDMNFKVDCNLKYYRKYRGI